MQTKVFLANIYCSEEFNQGLDNQIIWLSMINILLGITAIVGNTVILIALHKETSVHKPSKVFLRSLIASDLSVGFVQLASCAYWISILQRRWQICRLVHFFLRPSGTISIVVSLWTITAISVDRLLALLLKFRYRHVVTLRKVYAVTIASWVCNGNGFASLWYFSHAWKFLSVSTIAVSLFTSAYCYTRIFFRLRHQHNQVSNLREVENQQPRAGIRRYRKTVSSALWLQLAMLFCYLPDLLMAPFVFRKTDNTSSMLVTPLGTTITLMFFNSNLNPILYCWRIKEVRRAVKDILSCSRE